MTRHVSMTSRDRDAERSGGTCQRAGKGIIGNDPTLRDGLQQVRQVASTEATVMIRGESGRGKELIARAVHDLSSRIGGEDILTSDVRLISATHQSVTALIEEELVKRIVSCKAEPRADGDHGPRLRLRLAAARATLR